VDEEGVMAHTGRPNVTDAERKRMKEASGPKHVLQKAVEKRLSIPPDTAITIGQPPNKWDLLTLDASAPQGTFNKFFVAPFIKPNKKTRGRV
jgi:hypothetical protein